MVDCVLFREELETEMFRNSKWSRLGEILDFCPLQFSPIRQSFVLTRFTSHVLGLRGWVTRVGVPATVLMRPSRRRWWFSLCGCFTTSAALIASCCWRVLWYATACALTRLYVSVSLSLPQWVGVSSSAFLGTKWIANAHRIDFRRCTMLKGLQLNILYR